MVQSKSKFTLKHSRILTIFCNHLKGLFYENILYCDQILIYSILCLAIHVDFLSEKGLIYDCKSKIGSPGLDDAKRLKRNSLTENSTHRPPLLHKEPVLHVAKLSSRVWKQHLLVIYHLHTMGLNGSDKCAALRVNVLFLVLE